jgi:membrane protein CcdC involved in cytochrome C biogenesis
MGRSYFLSYWELKFNIMTDIFSLFRQGAFIVIVIYLKYLQGFQERTSLSMIFFYVSQTQKSDIFWVLLGVSFPVVIPWKAAFHEPNAPSFHFVLLF